MKLNFFAIILFTILLLSACNNSTQSTDTIVDPPSQSKQEVAQKISDFKVKLDAVDSLFNTSNWRLIEGGDTSYYYFSRQNETYMKVYHFKMQHGDSVNSITYDMRIDGQNLSWNIGSKILYINTASKTANEWFVSNDSTTKYVFNKKNNFEIEFIKGNQKLKLQKTLALSLFLVRSYYDFHHGTKYGLDSVDNFKVKVGKPIK